MTLVRSSPSGELTDVGDPTVQSVFGRTGVVVAEAGDYDTDEVVSFEDGVTTVSTTLETIRSTDGVTNQSAVPGATLTRALDALLSRQAFGSGSFVDTFMGGVESATSASTEADVGDLGWNIASFGGGGAFSVQKVAPAASTIGTYTLAGSATAGQGVNCYLGSPTTGLFDASNVERVNFRLQATYSGNAGSVVQVGIMNAAAPARSAALEGAGYLIDGDALGPNFQAVSVIGGVVTIDDTGVEADGDFHSLVVALRPGAIEFYIDGVLRLTREGAIPSGNLLPFWGTIGGSGGAASITLDNFTFVPTF